MSHARKLCLVFSSFDEHIRFVVCTHYYQLLIDLVNNRLLTHWLWDKYTKVKFSWFVHTVIDRTSSRLWSFYSFSSFSFSFSSSSSSFRQCSITTYAHSSLLNVTYHSWASKAQETVHFHLLPSVCQSVSLSLSLVRSLARSVSLSCSLSSSSLLRSLIITTEMNSKHLFVHILQLIRSIRMCIRVCSLTQRCCRSIVGPGLVDACIYWPESSEHTTTTTHATITTQNKNKNINLAIFASVELLSIFNMLTQTHRHTHTRYTTRKVDFIVIWFIFVFITSFPPCISMLISSLSNRIFKEDRATNTIVLTTCLD
jgi:hypothetical protein